jgi:hypothetical protein
VCMFDDLTIVGGNEFMAWFDSIECMIAKKFIIGLLDNGWKTKARSKSSCNI